MRESFQEATLAELRTLITRAREDAHRIAVGIEAARTSLHAEREVMRRQHAEHEEESDGERETGPLGDARGHVQQRVDRGETTWAAVMHEEDQHGSAQRFRELFADAVGNVSADLRVLDPEFAQQFEHAQDSAVRLQRRVREDQA